MAVFNENYEGITAVAGLLVAVVSLWVSLYSQWWIHRPHLQFVNPVEGGKITMLLPSTKTFIF